MAEDPPKLDPTALQVVVGEDPPSGKNKDYDDSDKFTSGVNDFIEKLDEENKPLGVVLRELIIHGTFLGIVCIIVFSSVSMAKYRFTEDMRKLFTQTIAPSGNNFAAIKDVDDVWEYMSNEMMSGLYWTGNDIDEQARTFSENQLVTLPRIRMVKIMDTLRKIPCYGTCKEDRAPFTPAGFNYLPAFTYTAAKELGDSETSGMIDFYGGGGFVQYLSQTDKDEALASIEFLKENRWISRGTRMVVVDFAVYNGNLNLFCIIKLMFEFPGTGAVIPTAQFNTHKLIRYVTEFEKKILVCEALFCVFVLMFSIDGFLNLCKLGLSNFLLESWNFIEILILELSIGAIVSSIRRTRLARSRINEWLKGGLITSSMDEIVEDEYHYINCTAMLCFLLLIKATNVFKYVPFGKPRCQLKNAIYQSAKGIGGFIVLFFVFLFAYAQLGHLLFDFQVQDFSAIYDPFVTQFRTIVGDYNFYGLENGKRAFAVLFLFFYGLFAVYVFFDMLLAIITGTCEKVKAKLARETDDTMGINKY